jgi:colanic acid biosynthesis protein WcaH
MFIKDALYSKIIRSVPILCVDILISFNDKYLLVKRNDNPLKGEWWVPGGRVLIGEDCMAATKRKLNEELNFQGGNLKLYGIYEDVFEESSLGIHPYHIVSIVYKLEIKSINGIDLNHTSSDWKLHDKIPNRLNNKIKKIN